MEKKHIRGNKLLLLAILLLVPVVIISGLQFLESTFYNPQTPIPTQPGKTIVRNGVEYFPRTDVTTVLLTGVDESGPMEDSGSYNNKCEADMVALLIFDETNKSINVLMLNRDTMVTMPVLGLGGKPAGTREGQLALAHTYGSGLKDSSENLRKTVSDYLYGVEIDLEFLYYLMPATKMNSLDMVNYIRLPFQFMGTISADWLYLGIVAAVGILLAVAAVLLYRKRNLETAGDFLSLPAAKPVFLLVYTLSVGYLISVLIPFVYLGLLIGILIGFFTGKMLLERTVKVFRGWNFLQIGILTTVLAITIGLTAVDAARLTQYVPETENVESMHFYFAGDRYLYQSVTVYVHYNLKNGMTVLRNYEVPIDTPEGAFTKQQLSCYQSVFRTNDWETYTAGVDQVAVEMNMKEEYFQFTFTDPAQVQGLLAAGKADCDAGNMAQVWSFHQVDDTSSWLYIYDNNYYDSEYTQESIGNIHRVYSLSLNIYESCENTIAYLETISEK